MTHAKSTHELWLVLVCDTDSLPISFLSSVELGQAGVWLRLGAIPNSRETLHPLLAPLRKAPTAGFFSGWLISSQPELTCS
ncbi:hypothetical protein GOODEAATRI_003422 [Goodea atripinnis]|uniref:Uncharacterized protein n=1 Tax=Goodea atripinnis TaxID=208336 RepID=A0ABV0P135_9TELE